MDRQLGYYRNTYGFIHAWVYKSDKRHSTQGGELFDLVGVISSHVDDEILAEWHAEVCHKIQTKTGIPVYEWFGGYYAQDKDLNL